MPAFLCKEARLAEAKDEVSTTADSIGGQNRANEQNYEKITDLEREITGLNRAITLGHANINRWIVALAQGQSRVAALEGEIEDLKAQIEDLEEDLENEPTGSGDDPGV